jgi:hypothetical protein
MGFSVLAGEAKEKKPAKATIVKITKDDVTIKLGTKDKDTTFPLEIVTIKDSEGKIIELVDKLLKKGMRVIVTIDNGGKPKRVTIQLQKKE